MIMSARPRRRIAARSGASAGASALALLAAPALAQETPAPADTASGVSAADVVVTGSRIRGVGPVASQTIALDRESLERTGLSTPAEQLRALPQISNLGADEGRIGAGAAQGAGANVTAATGINLRGLGTEATLTLLNGRRLPPGGQAGQLVDPNWIPAIALQRLEVVADGGSAIYGSDAVGGVVNLITRQPFSGAEATFRYGFGNDISQRQAQALLGTRWDGGGVILALEYNNRSRLSTNDRLDLYSEDFRSRGGADLRTTFASPGTIVVGTTTYAIPAGQNGRGLTAAQLVPGTANLARASAGADILPAQERRTAFASVKHDLGGLRLGLEGFYTKRDFHRFSNGSTATLAVPRSNAFFVSPAPGATSVNVRYLYTADFGQNNQFGSEEVYNGALTADLTVGGGWSVNGHLSHGRALEKRFNGFQIDAPTLATALADSNPATAFNPFADGTATNPATLASIRRLPSLNRAYLDLTDGVVKADGPLFDFIGGSARAAVGYEYIHQWLRVADQRDFGRGRREDSLGFQTRRTTHAGFAELYLPIVGDENASAGLQRLEFTGAIRYEEASDFGSTTNPKLGVRYQPVAGLSVRGSYGTSFRAPTLSDVSPFATAAVQIVNFVDPTATGGTRRGILYFGGNPDVQPETATTWSAGIDWRPPAIPGLSAAITYFNIDYQDRIDQPGQEANPLLRESFLAPLGIIIRNPTVAQVNALYDLPVFTGVREPAANIGVIVDARKVNAGRVKTSGIDFTLNYEWGAETSRWLAGGFLSYTAEYKRAIAPTAPLTEFVDTINFPPDWRGRGYAGWSNGVFNTTAFVNWTGSYRNILVTPEEKVDDYVTVDLQLAVELPAERGAFSGLRFSANIQNLLDAEPPYVRNGLIAYDQQQASPIGRLVSLQVTKRF